MLRYVTVPGAVRKMLFIAGICSVPAASRGSLVTNTQAADAMPDKSTISVVVVEDNYDANAALSRLLQKSGFDVVGRAYDGFSGLKVIKSTHPDVAILDIAMPAL